MDKLKTWQLSNQFNPVQVALLLCGEDPSLYDLNVLTNNNANTPDDFCAYLNAIKTDILSDELPAKIKYITYDPYKDKFRPHQLIVVNEDLDLLNTLLNKTDIQNWCIKKNISGGFFFCAEITKPAYLDETHPRYSPALHLAIDAWLYYESNAIPRGKHPKQALIERMVDVCLDYGVETRTGIKNRTAIEECAKVVNWKKKGGAPKSE